MKAKLLYTYFDNFSLHSALFCTTNLLWKIGTKFYQNRSGFVEDKTNNILVRIFGLQYK